MSDFLNQKRREIEERLRELAAEQKALVAEEKALTAASAALSKAIGSGARKPGRPPASTSSTPAKAKPKRASKRTAGQRGRPRGTGKRANEALNVVQANPGITIPEIAELMGIKQNYLYRVMPALQREKKVAKRGRGWITGKAAA